MRPDAIQANGVGGLRASPPRQRVNGERAKHCAGDQKRFSMSLPLMPNELLRSVTGLEPKELDAAIRQGAVLSLTLPSTLSRVFGYQRNKGELLQTLISTSSYAPDERLPQWRWFLRRICGDFDVEPTAQEEFFGEITAAAFGGISYKTIAACDIRLTRTGAWRHSDGHFFFIVQVDGTSLLRQAGAETLLHPGEMALIDSNISLEFLFREGCRQFATHIPTSLLLAYCQSRTPRLATRIESNGYAKALTSLLVTTAQQAACFDANSERLAIDQILSGIAHLVCSGGSEVSEPARPLLRSTLAGIQSLILNNHLSDSELTLERAASIVGMSSRKMQRLFQAAGTTYSNWLRSERLKRCYFDLVSPRARGISVTDVAFRWGFSDVSHFSRAFRAQFGACARDVRAGVARRPD